ncbi:c6 zinc finger domain-containing [Trichoderma arundinaceum]|uniref:C6 zinc finger domain-containing n=1 Tax=Trichoderma arundinaceum TaxID=490622 RepID=A0A395P0R2_TRIAR|nr:c6 zinc finger domain-containing [Trichoderma arundinaceum]
MAHQEVVNPGRNRKKRARTGCLRCRTRRRKCDERKPRCQRCIDAEAECVYGPRLSFLQKNAITLTSSNETGPSTKKADEPPKYSKVQVNITSFRSGVHANVNRQQFVDSQLDHQRDIHLSEEAQAPISSSPSIEGENNDIHNLPLKSGPEPITPSTSTEERPNLYLNFEDLNHENSENVAKGPGSQDEALPHNEEYRDQHIGTRPGDSYEIALDVLMTLGTGDPGVDTPAPAPPDSDDIAEINASSPPSILRSIEDLGPEHDLTGAGVAVALVKSATPFISSSLIRSLLRSSTQRGHKSGYIDFRYAHKSLVLCTEVLEFSYGDEETVDSLNCEPPKPRAVHWKSIVDELNDWYTNRPHTFRPVIELSAEESSFPIMYFTSGAATFANQLYHVAMMLMLAHKPRTIQLDQRRSSTLSQLWHAQRICGIATNNNRYECWDPCLLASFYLAARRMTHEAQQREVLLGFEHAGVLGWRVSSFTERLNQEWHASEPLMLC